VCTEKETRFVTQENKFGVYIVIVEHINVHCTKLTLPSLSVTIGAPRIFLWEGLTLR